MGLLLLCAGIAAITSGCAPTIQVDLPVSQIAEVAETGKPAFTVADAMIKQDGPTDCEAKRSIIAADLLAVGIDAKDIRCSSTETRSYIEFTMTTALVSEPGERPIGAGLVLEINAGNGQDVGMEVTAVGNSAARAVNQANDYDAADLVIPAIVFDLHNDTGIDYGIQFDQVFVDGEPFLADRGIDLPQEAFAPVQLSDVASMVVARGNANRFMALYPLP